MAEQDKHIDKHIDVPEADAQEQERPWDPREHLDENPRVGIDVPEADALDQAREIRLDEEEEAER
jgi:hypothetical protein